MSLKKVFLKEKLLREDFFPEFSPERKQETGSKVYSALDPVFISREEKVSMRIRHVSRLLSSLLLFILFLPLAGADLVKEGVARAFILLEKGSAPPLHLAAEEIASYAGKITGTPLKILSGADAEQEKVDYKIFFSLCTDPALGEEGYILHGEKDHLRISGNTPRAILYGAYAFMEEFFGVRFLAPGELYEFVPSRKTLTVPEKIRRRAKPEFSVRIAGFVHSHWNSDRKETWKYLIRNRWQIRGNPRLRSPRYCRGFAEDYDRMDAVYSGGGHCLAKLVPDQLFASHPEYFALVKGKRIRQINAQGKAVSQPCTTHPAVIALAVKGITEYFDNAPANSTYLLGNNDVQRWCECDSCTALDPPEEKLRGEVSTRFFTFITEVVRRVRKKHPDARIHAWGYQNFRFAPRSILPDRSLRINLCTHNRCYRHSLGDLSCTQNTRFREMFLSWRERDFSVTERGYQEDFLRSGYFYLPVEKVLADDLRFFRKIGVDGYEYITSSPDGTYGKRLSPQDAEAFRNAMYCLWPSLYVCGKMFWDTTLDPEKILADAGKHFYGRAWSVMKEYRKILRNAYTEAEGHILYRNPPVDLGKCLQSPGVEKKLLALLEKAEKLAAGDPDKKIALRLAQEKKYFLETWIANARLFEKTLPLFRSGAMNDAGQISIDGSPEESAWKKSPYMTGYSNDPDADLFVKLLFDRKNIYLLIAGTSPVPGEKFLLTFPDQKDLSRKMSVFDLDSASPFSKARKTEQGILFYEVKLPRSLTGLDEKDFSFRMNVKRVRSSRTAAFLFPGRSGSVALGKEVLKNGNFSLCGKGNRKRKNIVSDSFPAHWSFTGKRGAFENGSLILDGTVYQFMQVNGGVSGGTLILEMQCAPAGKKGRSSIRPYLSLGTRKPLSRGKFVHGKKKYSPVTPVKEKAVYRFAFPLGAYEQGYFYLRGGNVLVENITLTFHPETGKKK